MALAEGAQSHWLESAEEATTRASRLVQQLLQFARRTERDETPIEPADLVARTLDLVKETFDRRIMITFDTVPIVGVIRGDRGQLDQVILNLLINARDAVLALADEDRITAYVPRIEVHVGPAGLRNVDAVRIEVADNGVGMTEDVRLRALDPFFTTKGPATGTGLGLAIVAGVVATHGGTVLIDSMVGVGSTFVLLLPIRSTKMDPTEPNTPNTPPASHRVLVVDDEPTVAEITRAYLEWAGYEVTVVLGGMEAINELRRGLDLATVMLDTNMPTPTGWDVLTAAQAIPNAPPIIMTSGFGDAARAAQEGAAGFLSKPFIVADLIAAVEAAIDGRVSSSG